MWKRIDNVPKMDTTNTYKDMRYFIYYPPKNAIRMIDVGESVLVNDILTLVRKEFGLDINDANQSETYIALTYNGSALKPKWSLADLGIPSGSMLRCLYREKIAADLYIHCSYNKQILKLFDSSITLNTTIGTIRKIISNRLGLPLSSFCLETYDGIQRLYDEMKLINYDIKIHDHIYLKVWQGYEKFINACIKGFTEQYAPDDLSRHYQTQIALYIAAFYGHMDLANTVLQQGARSDQPVGEHPSRQWSSKSMNQMLPELGKCPIHIAVERGHVKMVDLFVRQSILCTQIPDPITGRLPYQIAVSCSIRATTKHDKQRYRVIYYYLYDKQFNLKIPINSTGGHISDLLTSTISAHTIHHSSTKHVFISTPLYCRIIRWYERARERAWKKYGGYFYTPTQSRRVYPKEGLLGYKVLIDGFNNTFEVPQEQLRNIRSGKDDKNRYMGFTDEEREKIIQMKTYVKNFALDDRKRAKQIAAANLRQTRRPPLLLTTSKKTSKQNKSSENVSSPTINLTPSTVIKQVEDEYNFIKPALKKLPSIPSLSLDANEKHTVPINITSTSNTPISYLSLTHRTDTIDSSKKNDIQSKMPSVDAYILASSIMNLEITRRKVAEQRELFRQVKESVQNQPLPQPEKPVNLLPDPLPVDRQSIDTDTYVALPEQSTIRRLSPIKSHIDVAVQQSVIQPYERYASATTRSTAVNCLQEAGYFKGKSWLRQVEISKEMVKYHVKRRIRRADKQTSQKLILAPLRTNT